jgi:hypothetical protein
MLGPLGRVDDQPRLADAGLAFDGERSETTALRGPQLLADRRELGRPADDVARDAADLELQGRERDRRSARGRVGRRCRGLEVRSRDVHRRSTLRQPTPPGDPTSPPIGRRAPGRRMRG